MVIEKAKLKAFDSKIVIFLGAVYVNYVYAIGNFAVGQVFVEGYIDYLGV